MKDEEDLVNEEGYEGFEEEQFENDFDDQNPDYDNPMNSGGSGNPVMYWSGGSVPKRQV